jgi:hypothetical protein
MTFGLLRVVAFPVFHRTHDPAYPEQEIAPVVEPS